MNGGRAFVAQPFAAEFLLASMVDRSAVAAMGAVKACGP